jgi:tetratricopeptide (TPR) repeat protein
MSRWPILLCLLAVGCVGFQTQVPLDAPDEAVDQLALAADALDGGDERRASFHLAAHLHDHPDDATTRAQLAETLFQQKRLAEARDEYSIFLATVQGTTGPVRKLLPHAHTRLMLIAQEDNDPAAEQLHRGMGLFALVESWDADSDRRDESAAGRTLMKCVRALRAATVAHPGRANLYLALAYDRLGQLAAARSALRCAAAAAPFDLTPWERDRLAALAAQ